MVPEPHTPYFSYLPVELALIISNYLSLKDRLSLTDTCRAFYQLLSVDDECVIACTRAGLSMAPGTTARAMAKSLLQPRVGVCNWSEEGGNPKTFIPRVQHSQQRGNLEFSRVWSITSALQSHQPVHLHPVFEPPQWLSLCKTNSLRKVYLRVSKDKLMIRLCRHRLYLHEYITCPPLDELRIMIYEDEGSIQPDLVAFRIRNPTGVTLGNFYEGLFHFLHSPPDPRMILTRQMHQYYQEPYHQFFCSENAEPHSDNLEFDRDCATNLKMFDTFCTRFNEDIPFSKKVLTSSLPLNAGDLILVIFAEYKREQSAFLESDANWGAPRQQFFEHAPRSAEGFWEDAAPVIQF